MRLIHLAAMLFAVIRMTDLMTHDQISEPLRRRWPQSVFLRCGRCVSVWTGVLATALYVVFPWANWPLALSALFILQAQILDRFRYGVLPREEVAPPNRRKLLLLVDAADNIEVTHSDFDRNGIVRILGRVAHAMHQRVGQ